MTFPNSMLGLLWMTVLHCVLLFPITIPVTVTGAWWLFKKRAPGQPPLPLTVWIPSALVVATLAWAAAFAQSPAGVWAGWRWPGLFGVVAVMCAVLVAAMLWRRANRDRRVAGASVVQIWILVVAAWVAAAAVSPGSGLGAL